MKLVDNSNIGVMFSMNSDDVKGIFSNEKKLEIRKNFPKLKLNYTAYIYCTKKGTDNGVSKGMVVGEFKVDSVKRARSKKGYETFSRLSGDSVDDVEFYAEGKPIYGIGISDVVKYDKGIPISEFKHPLNEVCTVSDRLRRPPQSWTYVELL